MSARVILKGQELTTFEDFSKTIGTLDNLITEDKNDVVTAINEVKNCVNGFNSETIKIITTGDVILEEMEAGIYKWTSSFKRISYGTQRTTISTMNGDSILIVSKGINKNTVGIVFSGYNSNFTMYDCEKSQTIFLNPTTLLRTNEEQTIKSKKIFEVLPVSDTEPTEDNEFVNKQYIDNKVGDISTILSTLTTISNGGDE